MSDVSRFVVTSSSFAAGHVIAAGIARAGVDLEYKLVYRPTVATESEADFFLRRARLMPEDLRRLEPGATAGVLEGKLASIESAFLARDRIELWVDPDPNSQLAMFHLVSRLGRIADPTDRVAVLHSSDFLASVSPGWVRQQVGKLQPLGRMQVDECERLWSAYRSSTPTEWLGLHKSGLAALPHSSVVALRLLQELPDCGSGLSASQDRLLRLVGRGDRTIGEAMAVVNEDPGEVLHGLDVRAALLGLMTAADPALRVSWRDLRPPRWSPGTGPLVCPHDLSDYDYWQRFDEGVAQLTVLGEGVLGGRCNYLRSNATMYWWGGTLVSNDTLWLWDKASGALVPPH